MTVLSAALKIRLMIAFIISHVLDTPICPSFKDSVKCGVNIKKLCFTMFFLRLFVVCCCVAV
jgi:hypothetical protein